MQQAVNGSLARARRTMKGIDDDVQEVYTIYSVCIGSWGGDTHSLLDGWNKTGNNRGIFSNLGT